MDLLASPDDRLVTDAYRAFFERKAPLNLTRDCEARRPGDPGHIGFDDSLWEALCDLGTFELDRHDDAGLPVLGLIAEEAGATLAPVPLVEVATVRRLVTRLDAEDLVDTTGAAVATVVPRVVDRRDRVLVDAGSMALQAVVYDGHGVHVVDRARAASQPVDNLAKAPLAYWTIELEGERPIAAGERAARAFREALVDWRTLLSHLLAGMASRALALAVEYAKTRVVYGSPIGAYQAIAHRLADSKVMTEGLRLLAYEAAWAAAYERPSAVRHSLVAASYAAEVAPVVAAHALHVHGGLGFTVESDVQLYARRAKGWALRLGSLPDLHRALGVALFDSGDSAPTARG
jgi:alkylation response protein AidB-like acyl-CoA dehydrogenase